MLVNRLLRAAIKAGGAVDIADNPSAAEYEDALESCNMMLNLWTVQRRIVFHVVSESFALTLNDPVYSIGQDSTPDFDTVRPNSIIAAYCRDSSNTDYPVKIIDREKYNRIPVKTLSSIPAELYYSPTYPNGIIYLDYAPSIALTLFIDSLKPLTALTLDAEVALPPEYQEAIKWNLALRLNPDYKVALNPVVAEMAKQSFNALPVQPVPEATFPGLPKLSGKSNILAGF
jgi:hypothetical protein